MYKDMNRNIGAGAEKEAELAAVTAEPSGQEAFQPRNVLGATLAMRLPNAYVNPELCSHTNLYLEGN